ncbi:MAG TPA: hypothetical protein VKW04_21260 [Planctomycetota bacterium]|nr:hypothetical protein [Planctomycetota bacterium]
MPPRVDFTDQRLSTLLDGLLSLQDTPPLVSPSLNLVLYGAAVPLDPPEDDPDADPQFRQLVMANEKRGPLYDKVGAFACSDDGHLWACIASEDVHWIIVNHEKKAQLGAGRPFVSPDGSAIAYTQTVREEGSTYPKTRVVVADQPGPVFQNVEPAGFSARGIFAYAAFDADQFGVIVGGEPLGPYGDVSELQWSPDGGRLAYIVGDVGRIERSVVVDTKRGPAYLDVRDLCFSPDSTRLAYVASEKEGERVVVDGKPGRLFASCLKAEFSGDSRSVIGRVGVAQKWAVAVNDQPGALYDEVGPPVYNHDATTVAYAARRGDRGYAVIGTAESEACDYVYRIAVGAKAGVAYALLHGKTAELIHNGRAVYRDGPRPNHLSISPDGACLAYSESHDGKVRIVVDGTRGEGYDSIDHLQFAPDGRTVVYIAREGERQFLVVGTKRHGPFQPLTAPAFSDDGSKLAVVVQIGREYWRKVLPLR